MKRVAPIIAFVLLTATAVATLLGIAPWSGRAQAAIFHVSFEHGDDTLDGQTPQTAWRHAPGDPMATAAPSRTALRPGDEVRFAAKARYRGAIVVTASGTEQKPIIFSGSDPKGSAIIDGSDPAVRVAPCQSAADCGNAQGWRKFVRIEFAAPLTGNDALFAAKGLLRPAQGPDPKDAFYRDETDDMLATDGIAVSGGRVALPPGLAAGLASGGGRLALWVKPNLIAYRPIIRMEGDSAYFNPDKLQFYTDRPSRVAVIDHVSLIDHPGEYALLDGGRVAVAMLPPDTGAISVGRGRGGFVVRKASHLVFRNLGFENMADGGGVAPAGVAIAVTRGASGITIENNRFRNFSMPRGQGPIIITGASQLTIVGNIIDTVSLGSGMRLAGPGSNVLVEGNVIRRLGRTAIMLMGVDDAMVRRNVISDVLGVHGNGLSAYMGNHRVQFIENSVTDAKQPATFHGNGADDSEPNNIVFANNLFIATPDALGSLISWGRFTHGVTIRNNVILGGRVGLRLSSQDSNVVIADNIVSGLVVAGGQPAEWRTAGNEWTQLSFVQKKEARAPKPAEHLGALAAKISQGTLDPAVCAILMRRSVPSSGASAASRAVGASETCP